METNFSLLCFGPNANAESNNSTSNLWLVQDKVSGQVTAAFLLLFLVVGLPWNLLVAITIVKEKLYHQPTIVLLLNLVLNDIILLVFEVPVRIVTGFAGEYVFGPSDMARCRLCLSGVLTSTFGVICLYISALMSFDRFLYIYKPLHYDRIITCCRMMLVICVLWVSLVSVTVIPAVLTQSLRFSPIFLACVIDINRSLVSSVVLSTVAVIPILVMMVCNVWVVVIVQKHIRAIYNLRSTSGDATVHKSEHYKALKKKRSQKQLHLFYVFSALLGSTIVSWGPLIFLVIYLEYGGDLPIEVSSTIHVLFVSQVVTRPIIETVLIKDVKEPMKKLVLWPCLRKKKSGNSEVFQENSKSSWSCDTSHVGCCREFWSAVEAALLEHSKPHSELEIEPVESLEIEKVKDT